MNKVEKAIYSKILNQVPQAVLDGPIGGDIIKAAHRRATSGEFRHGNLMEMGYTPQSVLNWTDEEFTG